MCDFTEDLKLFLQRDRKRAAAILIIQAYARSYLSRQRSKNEWRRDFDHSLKTDSSIDAIGQQLKWINLFCNIKVDSERLHDLGKKILAQQEKVLAKLSADITWRVRMKRFLILGLQGVQSSRTLSRVYIRLIEVGYWICIQFCRLLIRTCDVGAKVFDFV